MNSIKPSQVLDLELTKIRAKSLAKMLRALLSNQGHKIKSIVTAQDLVLMIVVFKLLKTLLEPSRWEQVKEQTLPLSLLESFLDLVCMSRLRSLDKMQ